MNSLIRVEQSAMTVGELKRKIEKQSNPIRRSTHVGNQPPHELLLMNAMPNGIDILMVDTIQGTDKYAMPRVAKLAGNVSIALCSRKQASGRVVSAVAVESDCLLADMDLVCRPIGKESLADFHNRALDMLPLSNRPVPMMKFFGSHGDVLSATMAACHRLGKLSRRVGSDGSIVTDEAVDPGRSGVFGIDDVTSPVEGVMLPLNGMMALDMSITASLGGDMTTHLAGPHMAEYANDELRMHEVGLIMASTASELGARITPHLYEVVDITGLSRLVTPETHASQHQLLRVDDGEIWIDNFASLPCRSI